MFACYVKHRWVGLYVWVWEFVSLDYKWRFQELRSVPCVYWRILNSAPLQHISHQKKNLSSIETTEQSRSKLRILRVHLSLGRSEKRGEKKSALGISLLLYTKCHNILRWLHELIRSVWKKKRIPHTVGDRRLKKPHHKSTCSSQLHYWMSKEIYILLSHCIMIVKLSAGKCFSWLDNAKVVPSISV